MEIKFNALPLVAIDEIYDLLSQAKGRKATNKNFWKEFEKGGIYFIVTHPKTEFYNIIQCSNEFGPVKFKFDLLIKTKESEIPCLKAGTIDFEPQMRAEGWENSVGVMTKHVIGISKHTGSPSHEMMLTRPINEFQEVIKCPFRIEYIGEATKKSVLQRAIIDETHEGLKRTLVNKESDLNVPHSIKSRFTRNMDIFIAPLLLDKESKDIIAKQAKVQGIEYKLLRNEILKDAEKVIIHTFKPEHCSKLYGKLLTDKRINRIHRQRPDIKTIRYTLENKFNFYSKNNRLYNWFSSQTDEDGNLSLRAGFKL